MLACGGIIMPRSPRWLVSNGRPQDAFKTLVRVRGPEDDVRIELAQICEERRRELETGKPSWGEFFSGDSLKLLFIGISLQIIQQMCGMNAFMYMGPQIFQRLSRRHRPALFSR